MMRRAIPSPRASVEETAASLRYNEAVLGAVDGLLAEILGTFRQTLHACPEGSNHEIRTAHELGAFLSAYGPDGMITGLGGHGLAAIYEGSVPGPTVLVRAELDAVPVEMGRSATAHKCGHDGHMAIVAGIAPLVQRARHLAGRIVLLFQPAEETGEGAARVLADPKFESIWPDFAIALHNLPGYPQDMVVIREDVFASASVGMHIHLAGEASHAAEPDKGRPPAAALGRLLEVLPKLSAHQEETQKLLTITHAAMGRPSFGVSPGNAELFATLRAKTLISLRELKEAAFLAVQREATKEGLDLDVSWVEEFPETRNDPRLVRMLSSTAADLGLEVTEVERPFRWSDDFGHFAAVIPSVYFGLGIGAEAARLHQLDYSFPESTITTGLALLHQLALRLLATGQSEESQRVA